MSTERVYWPDRMEATPHLRAVRRGDGITIEQLWVKVKTDGMTRSVGTRVDTDHMDVTNCVWVELRQVTL